MLSLLFSLFVNRQCFVKANEINDTLFRETAYFVLPNLPKSIPISDRSFILTPSLFENFPSSDVFIHHDFEPLIPTKLVKEFCPFTEKSNTCINDDAAVVKNFQANLHTIIYPKCNDLIKYIPCLAYHTNWANLSIFEILNLEPEKDKDNLNIYTSVFRPKFCHSFAKKLYKHCRFVPFNSKTWVIEPDLGYNDFLKQLGIYNTTEAEDVPLENCWDYEGN